MADTHIKINAVTPRVQYVGDGSTTSFPYAFAIFDDSDMVVYVGDEIIETGYTVTGAGQTEGGNVVFDTAPENGDIITLLRNVPIERVTDFQEGGTFRPKNINDEFDRQTAFAQQVQEALSRCVKVDPTSSTNPEDVIPKVEALYDDITNLDAVANDLINIDTVATNISDVGTCATNMEDIQAAPGAATTASNAAIAAAASAEAAQEAALSITGYDLFDHKWSDHLLNDQNWLRADTFSWQDGAVYSEAYNHLVDDYTNGTDQTETIAGVTISYKLAPDGHKIYNSISGSLASAIYDATGVAWYYVLDTLHTRFKLPRTKYGIVGLRDTVGKYVEAGVPDITAQLDFSYGAHSSGPYAVSGAASAGSTKVGRPSQYDTLSAIGIVDIKASDSNSIYGNSTTVQPPATQMYLYFYVGNFTQTATEQTAGLNSELFNGKVDLNAANLSTAGKSLISGLGMPSDRYDDLTLGVSGTEYIAPANGYYSVAKISGLVNGWINIYSNGVAYTVTGPTAANSIWLSVPVKKGNSVVIAYNMTGITEFFRFIYAQGEENV